MCPWLYEPSFTYDVCNLILTCAFLSLFLSLLKMNERFPFHSFLCPTLFLLPVLISPHPTSVFLSHWISWKLSQLPHILLTYQTKSCFHCWQANKASFGRGGFPAPRGLGLEGIWWLLFFTQSSQMLTNPTFTSLNPLSTIWYTQFWTSWCRMATLQLKVQSLQLNS